MSAGYLAVSHPTWCDHIAATRPHRCAFWRRATTRFRALAPGDPFFFLRKQVTGRPLSERRVIGKAEFRMCENRPLGDLVGYYGLHELGVASSQQLESRLIEIASNRDPELPRLVGIIQLGAFEEFRHPVEWQTLARLGIKFSANIVQGMGLNENQVEALLDAGLYGVR